MAQTTIRKFISPIPILIVFACFLIGCSQKKETPESQIKLQLPKGWYLSINNSDIAYLQASEKTSAYRIQFDRAGTQKEDRYYIQIAESIYPNQSQLSRALGQKVQERWYFERRWWSEEYINNRVPYSLTADTVNYYIEKYKEAKKMIKSENIEGIKQGNKNRVHYSYTARVFREVNTAGKKQLRVELKMKWYQFCGQPCGWGFEKKREVIFSGKKRVTKIIGDEVGPKWVSTPENPYAPDQWITF